MIVFVKDNRLTAIGPARTTAINKLAKLARICEVVPVQ
jgi:hypothetical protein